MDDFCGYDVLGADPVSAIATSQAQLNQLLKSPLVADRDKEFQKQEEAQKAESEKFKKAATTFVVSGLAGAVLGGGIGAFLWTSHRLIGGLIGFFLVGPAVGYGAGMAIAMSMEKKK